jgi:hypothetical protein
VCSTVILGSSREIYVSEQAEYKCLATEYTGRTNDTFRHFEVKSNSCYLTAVNSCYLIAVN